ncbi:MAG TPA: alkaline phosphatase D family protein [Planctomycetaceae bacterium]|nr:alkaline phosphatase D family protein [Planctomycetaceae bacterium]
MRYSMLLSICLLIPFDFVHAAGPVHLGMGIKIGELTSDSAIVWARVTKHPHRNRAGRAGEGVLGPVRRNSEHPLWEKDQVNELHGSMPGAEGRLQLLIATNKDLNEPSIVPWEEVHDEVDYVKQFALTGLEPGTKYYFRVEAAPLDEEQATATVESSFTTPSEHDRWQDVSFGVITGMMYQDLDHEDGFRIFPAMQELDIDFLVPTGDTVYYDNELPRARTVAMARYHWHRMYSLPRLIEFHNQIPTYWEKDDHDTLSDDAWPTLRPKMMLPLTWDDGLEIFREQVPMGENTHRTIRWGEGLQIWLVEGRDFRSPNNAPDGPEKTIWGVEQREWLMKSILESDATFKVLVSPTPIVGPDRKGKKDNHSNEVFAFEGNLFRDWTREHKLNNLFVCCGDRHWQYHSVDPQTGLHEFSCGPASDEHAGGTPGHDMMVQPFHRVKGGFLTVNVFRNDGGFPELEMRHHDVQGKVVYRYKHDADK